MNVDCQSVPAPSRPKCIFIGLGPWGRRLLTRVVQQFDVAALVSNGAPASVDWSARHYPGIPYVSNLPDALSIPSLRAAFLATPTHTHSDLALRALRAGCHVFVEKPLALASAPAARAVSAALERDLELFIGYVYLFHPAFRLIQSLAPSETIHSLHFEWTRPQLSGPLHEELLCHELALVVALMAELPLRLRIVSSSIHSFHAVLHLPSGRTCSVRLMSPATGVKEKSMTVLCTNGVTHVWRGDHVITEGRSVHTGLCRATSTDALSNEVSAFRSAVEGNCPRMIADQRFSLGITALLDEVCRKANL